MCWHIRDLVKIVPTHYYLITRYQIQRSAKAHISQVLPAVFSKRVFLVLFSTTDKKGSEVFFRSCQPWVIFGKVRNIMHNIKKNSQKYQKNLQV